MSQECEMAEEALIAKQARIDELEMFVRNRVLNPGVYGLRLPEGMEYDARVLMGLPIAGAKLGKV